MTSDSEEVEELYPCHNCGLFLTNKELNAHKEKHEKQRLRNEASKIFAKTRKPVQPSNSRAKLVKDLGGNKANKKQAESDLEAAERRKLASATNKFQRSLAKFCKEKPVGGQWVWTLMEHLSPFFTERPSQSGYHSVVVNAIMSSLAFNIVRESGNNWKQLLWTYAAFLNRTMTKETDAFYRLKSAFDIILCSRHQKSCEDLLEMEMIRKHASLHLGKEPNYALTAMERDLNSALYKVPRNHFQLMDFAGKTFEMLYPPLNGSPSHLFLVDGRPPLSKDCKNANKRLTPTSRKKIQDADKGKNNAIRKRSSSRSFLGTEANKRSNAIKIAESQMLIQPLPNPVETEALSEPGSTIKTANIKTDDNLSNKKRGSKRPAPLDKVDHAQKEMELRRSKRKNLMNPVDKDHISTSSKSSDCFATDNSKTNTSLSKLSTVNLSSISVDDALPTSSVPSSSMNTGDKAKAPESKLKHNKKKKGPVTRNAAAAKTTDKRKNTCEQSLHAIKIARSMEHCGTIKIKIEPLQVKEEPQDPSYEGIE